MEAERVETTRQRLVAIVEKVLDEDWGAWEHGINTEGAAEDIVDKLGLVPVWVFAGYQEAFVYGLGDDPNGDPVPVDDVELFARRQVGG